MRIFFNSETENDREETVLLLLNRVRISWSARVIAFYPNRAERLSDEEEADGKDRTDRPCALNGKPLSVNCRLSRQDRSFISGMNDGNPWGAIQK